MVVFGGLCVGLEAAGKVLFTSPGAFALCLLMPWFWWMHVAGYSGLRGSRSVIGLLVRLCLVGLLIATLAEPRAVRRDEGLSVVYALDVSDSIGESASDSALRYVTRTVSERKDHEHDAAGLVVFGREAAVELPPRPSFPFEQAINSRVRKDGTDLGKGLSLSAAMLPEERLGRIVLITDGTQTEGDLAGALADLQARDIPVDVLPIQYDYENEVWVEKLDLPRSVRSGETYEARVVVSALSEGSGTLTLTENGNPIYEGEVDYQSGKNRYVLPVYLRGPGYYEYVAQITPQPGLDGWSENNRAINHLYLRGEGKVMLVTDPAGDRRDWQPLSESMSRGGFQVEQRVSYAFPEDALSLMPYDCVVFVNVPADDLSVMQMEAVRTAVYNQGTGFMMVGGQNSFGPGGYHRTAIEKVLPVSMDITQKKILPKGALVIVLHTCEFDQGNTWGKRVAKQAIRVLGAQDEAGVLVFDWSGGEQWLFKLTPAGEYEELVRLINQAQIGDMPSFGVTMQMGLTELKASDASMKHMIIISDGDPQPPLPSLLKGFSDAKISVSTVAINPHQPQDTTVLQAIAGATGGRFHFPSDPSQLPSIFIKEAKTLKRSMIQEGTFHPVVQAPSPILKGIEAFPVLDGYVVTSPKGRSLTVLKGPGEEEVDPVLSTWRYGTGKSAAFTSDLSSKWAAAWIGWGEYDPFVQQLITDISRTEREGFLQAQCFASGSEGTILIEDFHPRDSFLEIETVVTGPENRSQTVRLKQTGPRRYEGSFPLWGKGRYQVVGAGVGDGRSERIVDGFVVPYSAEYLRFRSSPIVLRQIAERTGGRLLTGDETGEEVFLKDREPKADSRPIAGLLLVVLTCLLPLDVAVRRIQIDWALIRGWFGGETLPSGETFQALLRRKEEVQLPRSDERAAALRKLRARSQPAWDQSPESARTPEAGPPAEGEREEAEGGEHNQQAALAEAEVAR